MEHATAPSDQKQLWYNISNAAFHATAKSLKTPHMVDAIVREGGRRTNGLLAVYWVSAVPMADGVIVRTTNAQSTNFPFDSGHLEQNRRDASNSVSFYAIVPQSALGELWPRLLNDGGRVTLTAGGKEISNELNLRTFSHQ